MHLIDITEPLSPATAVWPGDTPFSRRWVMRMEEGHSCNVSTIVLSTHCGTHSDAPYHFDPEGVAIDQVPLDCYLGPCRVLRVEGAGDPPSVPLESLADDALAGVRRVLFRTRDVHRFDRFDKEFCCLGKEAAARLVELGVKLVGIDTPSMDPFQSKDLAAHRILLKGGVAILENLDLSRAEPGDYELLALPLRIVGGDSAPVRAVLRSRGGEGSGA